MQGHTIQYVLTSQSGCITIIVRASTVADGRLSDLFCSQIWGGSAVLVDAVTAMAMLVLVRRVALAELCDTDESTRAAVEAEIGFQADDQDREQGYTAHCRNW